MAALPPVSDVIKATMLWNATGDTQAQTILHWAYSGSAPSSTDLGTLGAAFNSAVNTQLKPLFDSSVVYQGVILQDLSSSTGAVRQTTASITGTRTGGALTAANCLLMNHHIAQHYRGGKPRSYLPFGSQTDTSTGRSWNPSFITTCNTNWGLFQVAFIGQVAGGTTITHQCAVSYYQGYNAPTTLPSGRVKQTPKLRGTPVVYTITDSAANVVYATQRRRYQR